MVPSSFQLHGQVHVPDPTSHIKVLMVHEALSSDVFKREVTIFDRVGE